jgi:hypothetical protein
MPVTNDLIFTKNLMVYRGQPGNDFLLSIEKNVAGFGMG